MTASNETILSQIAEHVAALLLADFSDLKECAGMAGRFSLDELKHRGARTPAVLVSLLGSRLREERSGQFAGHDLQMVAYVIAGEGAVADRDRTALIISQRVMQRVNGSTWGLAGEGVQGAEKVALNGLVTASLRGAGASLWAVQWSQPLSLGALPPDTGPVSTHLYLTGPVVPPAGSDEVAS